MKKMISIILAIAFSLSLVGVATAAAPKPPVNLCVDTGALAIFSLATKPLGVLKTGDGPRKLYGITGFFLTIFSTSPATGSGYMNENTFHFNVDSTYNPLGTLIWLKAEGFWNVVDHTGTLDVYFSSGTTDTYTLTEVACDELDIVGMQGSGAALPNAGSPFVPRK